MKHSRHLPYSYVWNIPDIYPTVIYETFQTLTIHLYMKHSRPLPYSYVLNIPDFYNAIMYETLQTFTIQLFVKHSRHLPYHYAYNYVWNISNVCHTNIMNLLRHFHYLQKWYVPFITHTVTCFVLIICVYVHVCDFWYTLCILYD
jgi:hypothetical protein